MRALCGLGETHHPVLKRAAAVQDTHTAATVLVDRLG